MSTGKNQTQACYRYDVKCFIASNCQTYKSHPLVNDLSEKKNANF